MIIFANSQNQLKRIASMQVKIVNKSKHNLPKYATEASAGMDLHANIDKPTLLKPRDRFLLPTGFYNELPVGYEAQVRPRNGMAIGHGLTVLNTPGTIDAGYRGEIKVIVFNLSNQDYEINDGERVAQMVISEHAKVHLIEVDELTETDRGSGGYGHTGRE